MRISPSARNLTVVAIKLRAMGDTVLFSASLQAIRNQLPKCNLHAVIPEQWAPLLEHHPAVTQIWPMRRPDHRAARAKAIALMAWKLRQLKPDAVLNAHASPSSAWLAFATGAPIRAIHFHGLKAPNRFSTVDIDGKGVVRPAIQRDLDATHALLRALGSTPAASASPRIQLSSEESRAAQHALKDQGVHGPRLAISPGASRPSKRWDPASFVHVADHWKRVTGGNVLWFGSSEETLPTSATHPFEIKGAPLRRMAAHLQACDVWLGNDSGPKHLAIALGRPTVTVMGPEDPFEWHPYDRETHPFFYIPDLACRNAAPPGFPAWCGLETCTVEGHKCMKGIDPDEVARKCVERLGNQNDENFGLYDPTQWSDV